MNLEQAISLGLITALLALFIWGKWRYDLVAFIGLIIAAIFQIVPAHQTFIGFSHPATITIALVLIISHAFTVTGAFQWVTRYITDRTHSTWGFIGLFTLLAAFLSMFMNNVGALAILMPTAIETAKRTNRSPGLILMPLSFGSILGGLVTQIGTPPNIIIAGFRADIYGEPFKMFDFTPVGGLVAVAGLLYLSVIGWRLVKVRDNDRTTTEQIFDLAGYLFEVKILEDSPLIDKTLKEVSEELKDNAVVLKLINKNGDINPIERVLNQSLKVGDILAIETSPQEIDAILSKNKLAIYEKGQELVKLLHDENKDTFELVLTPNCSLERRQVKFVRFFSRFHLHLLAVSRQGKAYPSRLKDIKLRLGDVLLLHGEEEHMQFFCQETGCLPLAKREIYIGKSKYGWQTSLLFFASIALVVFNLLPIYIAFSVLILIYLLMGILPFKSVYQNIDWSVIVLIGALLPLGKALEVNGTTTVLTTMIFNMVSGVSPIFLLAIVLVITMAVTDVLNNAATAILMAPIAVRLANEASLNPDAFLMAVAIGSSCAFLTPIGHQNNALIMGPGQYRFGDYWRMGLPLDIIIAIIGTISIKIIWGL